MDSVWSTHPMPRFPALEGDICTEVLVIGGGMAGILTAHMLKQAGAQVVVAEADQVGMGITQNTTAKITAQHGLCYQDFAERSGKETAGLYLQANQEALGQFRALCRERDCDFEEQDSFVFSRDDLQTLDEECHTLNALGFPAELKYDLPLPFPTAGAVKFPRQGQFHPLKLLASLAPELRIYAHTPVRQLQGSTALCDRGRIRAEKIIVATHFPFLNKHGFYFLKLYQQRSYVLALEGVPEWQGMYLEERENGLSFRRFQGLCLLGGGGHRTGKAGGGWRELENAAARYYPDARITHRWATQDCMTLDGIPYIGQYSPATPGLYVATGFNKWGMTSSMISALLLRDLIAGRENPFAGLFSPDRSMLHPQLGSNILESARNLLTPTTPRCPHMGCALKWNSQEHSWDCPCHGSRFDENGSLTDNPATRSLKERS